MERQSRNLINSRIYPPVELRCQRATMPSINLTGKNRMGGKGKGRNSRKKGGRSPYSNRSDKLP